VLPELDVIIHTNYGLPQISHKNLKERLIILSSYSGNTEETTDAYEQALRLGLQTISISIGGKLIEKAKKNKTSYIKMPDFNIQPRSALPLSLKSILKAIDEEKKLKEIEKLAKSFYPKKFEKESKKLAETLKGYIPIIYASDKNISLAYNWKIKFNETGKIPAFYNVLPELNHNEMTGYDVRDTTRMLSEKFYFIFLKDKDDDTKTRNRMDITAKLYDDRKLKTIKIEISGENIFHKIFNTLAMADFTAYFTAEGYGLESEQVPMVEEFKKLIEN
ncbi:MAG: SIS domain-containing protein, partial [bacterium]